MNSGSLTRCGDKNTLASGGAGNRGAYYRAWPRGTDVMFLPKQYSWTGNLLNWNSGGNAFESQAKDADCSRTSQGLWTRNFIAAFSTAQQCPILWVTSIKSTPQHTTRVILSRVNQVHAPTHYSYYPESRQSTPEHTTRVILSPVNQVHWVTSTKSTPQRTTRFILSHVNQVHASTHYSFYAESRQTSLRPNTLLVFLEYPF